MRNHKLEFTGERMINSPGSGIYRAHINRYKFASKFANRKVVLDIACGTGYGSSYLSRFARRVVGVDVQKDVLEFCVRKYKKPNLEFLMENKHDINLRLTHRFDTIVCFETIEHVPDYKFFLKKLKEYLKRGGTLILSTPNNFLHQYPPANKFHIYEFDIIELSKILHKSFAGSDITLYGQGRTLVRRSDRQENKDFLRSAIGNIFGKIFEFDANHTKLLRLIAHRKFYKLIGNLQRNYPNNIDFYKINPNTDFTNPEVAIYVVRT